MLKTFFDGARFQQISAAMIVANTVCIFLGSYADLREAVAPYGGEGFFHRLDEGFVIYFCAELLLRMTVLKGRFFSCGWNWFDLIVILPSVMPGLNTVSVTRIFRLFRLLRLISAFASLRNLITAMMRSLADTAAIAGIAVLCIFIFAAISHGLFKENSPELFGNVGTAMFTLFRVFAFMDIAGVLDTFDGNTSLAMAVFTIFFILMTYVILNFFIAIAMVYINSVMQEKYDAMNEQVDDSMELLHAELVDLRQQIAAKLRKDAQIHSLGIEQP